MYILNFCLTVLKTGAIQYGSMITELNPFDQMDILNHEYSQMEKPAKAKLLHYQDCTKEWNEHLNKNTQDNIS